MWLPFTQTCNTVAFLSLAWSKTKHVLYSNIGPPAHTKALFFTISKVLTNTNVILKRNCILKSPPSIISDPVIFCLFVYVCVLCKQYLPAVRDV